ncbi:inner membrane protein yihy, formerly thought to be rnase bn [hydrocarbon metagenome]|uniref:Inner membrane protein yihy, formerly thought to be rnase bn n=1 Tax=hydrocarbon metagenome TaxID=938273 RepID=A0A0W8G9Y4_9ZZZZ
MNATTRDILRTARSATRDFFRHQGLTQAAALAFYALISFIPMGFLLISLHGMLVGDTWEAQLLVKRHLGEVAPWADELLVGRMRRLVWAAPHLRWPSLVFIAWTSCLFFSALRASLRHPWKGGEERVSLPRRVAAWCGGPVVSGLLTAVLTGLLVLAHTSEGLFPSGRLWGEALKVVWSLGCLATLFFCIYALGLPHIRPLRAAGPLCLGLAAAAYAVTAVFTWFVTAMPRYNMVYGSLAGAVLFVLWLHYSTAVILWGGHFLRIWRQGHAPKKYGRWFRLRRPRQD